MAQSRTQYSAMKTEILTDPLVRGYAGMTDLGVLDNLHVKDRSRNRTNMTGREVKKEVPSAAYNSLTNEKKAQFLALTASDSLDPFGLDANVVKDIFGAGSTAVSNLAAARVELVSRLVERDLGSPGLGNIVEARS